VNYLGPNLLTDRWDPTNLVLALQSGARMVVLGPGQAESQDPSIVTDPVQILWVVVGKLLAIRNLGGPWWQDLRVGTPETSSQVKYRRLASAMVDQSVTGSAASFEVYRQCVQPAVTAIESALSSLTCLQQAMDSRIESLLKHGFAPVMGLPAGTKTADVIDALLAYHQSHGLWLEDAANGFHDYMLMKFRDSSGIPAAFVVSTSPKVPDSWIATDVLLVNYQPN